jgi:mono/diheme cytochrome c family protein
VRALVGGIVAGVVLALAWPVFAQPQDPVARGHEVFQYWCATCHGAGPGHPGTDALQAKYHGSKPALLEDRTDLTPDEVRYFVRHGVTIMPFFRKTEISDADLDAIGAYLSRKR